MHRRNFFHWMSVGLSGLCAAVVGLPGVSFILEALRRGGSTGTLTRRVAKLKDLTVGKPVRLPMIGSRRDAWTEHPSEVLGQVWIVRKRDSSGTNDEVLAFTATCPHLGCLIQHDDGAGRFVCPCHRAVFDHEGQKISPQKGVRENHAPRGMDSLACQLVEDEATHETWVEVTFEKFEPGLTASVVRA